MTIAGIGYRKNRASIPPAASDRNSIATP